MIKIDPWFFTEYKIMITIDLEIMRFLWLFLAQCLPCVNLIALIYDTFRIVKLSLEGVGGDGASAAAALNQRRLEHSELFQYYLDKTTPHATYRWIGTFVLALLYALRVYYVQGFYVVTYGLGIIYILNLLIGFLSPLVDPELEPSDGPMWPTKDSDEFKPFIRHLTELKFL
ncbi:protein RER1A-like [Lycium barbarum]|uniref:protein RER1A-like n=1 Tax=Lycium barbarum TaxID=112863 RepID=UPI00293EC38B|nr:protein RER1A-like [Lycium barbarum]